MGKRALCKANRLTNPQLFDALLEGQKIGERVLGQVKTVVHVRHNPKEAEGPSRTVWGGCGASIA